MRKMFTLVVVAFALLAAQPSAQITIPYPTFVAGTRANPDEVNANNAALASQALNRTGGTVTGTIAVNGGITIDGYDLGVQIAAILAAYPNASNLTSGTVADARLSANVPLLNGANTWTNTNAFGTVTGTSLHFTNVWADTSLRVGSSTTPGYILTSDASGYATWASPGEVSGVPSGLVAMFMTPCPATWARVSQWDGKFVRGGETYAVSGGGSDTHSHTITGTAASAGDHSHTTSSSGSTVAAGAHSHGTFNTGPGGTSGGHDTDYTNLTHTHSGTTDPGGDHTHTLTPGTNPAASGSDFGAYTALTMGGSGDHVHNFTTGGASVSMDHRHTIPAATTTSVSDHVHTITALAGTTNSTGAHTHTVSGTSNDVSNVPVYAQVVFCQKM